MTRLRMETEDLLTEAGWRPHRRWGGLSAVQAKDEQYRTTGPVADFLSEFGGPLLRNPSPSGADTKTKFDPVKAARDLDPEWLREYARRAGVSILPVGQAYDGHMTVLMGADARVFLAYDDEFQCIGDDACDGLNALCLGASYQEERARRHFQK